MDDRCNRDGCWFCGGGGDSRIGWVAGRAGGRLGEDESGGDDDDDDGGIESIFFSDFWILGGQIFPPFVEFAFPPMAYVTLGKYCPNVETIGEKSATM